jgi:chromosome segregation ATPase
MLQEAMTKRSGDRARVNQQLAPEKAKLTELQKRLHGVADEPTLQVNRAKVEQNIAGIDANINKVQQDLAQAEFDLQSLQGSRVPKKK